MQNDGKSDEYKNGDNYLTIVLKETTLEVQFPELVAVFAEAWR